MAAQITIHEGDPEAAKRQTAAVEQLNFMLDQLVRALSRQDEAIDRWAVLVRELQFGQRKIVNAIGEFYGVRVKEGEEQ